MVLRASTDNTLDDLERAVDDGVNAYRVRVAFTGVTKPRLHTQMAYMSHITCCWNVCAGACHSSLHSSKLGLA